MKKLIIVMALVFFTAGLYAKEGYYIKLLNRVPQADGSPDQEIVSEQYITADAVKTVTMDQIILISKNGMQIYNVKNKVFIEQTIAQLASIMQMYDSGYSDFQIKSTGEKIKTGKWNTEKYAVSMTMMGVKTSYFIYITKDVDYPSEVLYRSQMLLCPTCNNTKKMIQEYQKIGGFHVKIEMTAMGASGNTEVTEIKKMEISDELIAGPKGYKKAESPAPEGDQLRKNENEAPKNTDEGPEKDDSGEDE